MVQCGLVRSRADDYITQVLEDNPLPLFPGGISLFSICKHGDAHPILIMDWPTVNQDTNPMEIVSSLVKGQLKEGDFIPNRYRNLL